MHVQAMISTHPTRQAGDLSTLIACVEACFDCAQACIACADACLAEEMVAELRQCIRLNLDCADICNAAGAIASRRSHAEEAILRPVLEVCAQTCRRCEMECRRHAARHEHCRICAEACSNCDRACSLAAQSALMH